jgi:hypothetical protein
VCMVTHPDVIVKYSNDYLTKTDGRGIMSRDSTREAIDDKAGVDGHRRARSIRVHGRHRQAVTHPGGRASSDFLLRRAAITASSRVLLMARMAPVVPYLRCVVVAGTKPR